MGGDVPSSKADSLRRLADYTGTWLRRNMQPLKLIEIPDFEEWVAHTHYPGWRVEELRTVYNELLTMIKPCSQRKVVMIKAFQKIERYNKLKEPRGIYSRSDFFKVFCGPIFKAIESKLYSIGTSHHGTTSYDLRDGIHSETFVKHIPVSERAEHVLKKLKGPGRSYMATDYTAYEKHFTKELMETIEFQLYRFMVSRLPLASLMMEEIIGVLGGMNVIHFRDFVVRMRAARMSGEMNTSLGNGFANMIVYFFLHHEKGNRLVDGVFEGDDGLGCYVGTSLTKEDYEDLGLTCKIILIDNVSEASFCGLIFDEECLVSITDPIKALLNVGWSNYF